MGIFNFIKNIFKADSVQKSQSDIKASPNAYYFHEDDYCQIEYLPKENFNTASKVATNIIEHSENTFDGVGWTGLYVRNEASVPTKSKNFKVANLSELLLSRDFVEYSSVTTGYSSAVFLCNNTKAYRKQSIVFCFDFTNETIGNIWHNYLPQEEDNVIFKELLLTMADEYEFLLADWRKSIVVDISNPNEIDKYLAYED